MTKFTIHILTALTLSALMLQCNTNDQLWQLTSPDQNIRIEISQLEPKSSSLLSYSIYMKQNGSYKQIMDLSPLGIEREDSRFIENLEFVSLEQEQNIEDSYSLVSGKKLQCNNIFNTLTVTFKNQDKQKVSLNFRTYNDGIAFRYVFPGKSENNVRVINELTGFDFKDGNFWAHPYDTLTTWNPAYETFYRGPVNVGTTAPWNKNGWAFPILVESEGAWILVSEAGFDGTYGASHLYAKCEKGRYIAIGNTLHEIVENTLSTDLSSPSKLDNTSWIKPGRASWSWWSDSDSPKDYDRLLPFVDLAADMGWEYSLVDAYWNHMKTGDLEKLAKYAGEKKHRSSDLV